VAIRLRFAINASLSSWLLAWFTHRNTVKAKIHYTSFPVASLQQDRNIYKRQVRNKSVTSWRGQKSVVSVVSCRFPNSITTISANSLQQVGNFPAYGEVTGKRVQWMMGIIRRNMNGAVISVSQIESLVSLLSPKKLLWLFTNRYSK